MPYYIYRSENCTLEQYIKSDVDGLHILISADTEDWLKEPLLWEEFHTMSDLPETMPCPVTGEACMRAIVGVSFQITGSFLRDKKATQLLSNIHRLENDDPYDHCRPSGEGDDKIAGWRKELERDANRKTDPKHWDRIEQREQAEKQWRNESGELSLPGKENTTIEIR